MRHGRDDQVPLGLEDPHREQHVHAGDVVRQMRVHHPLRGACGAAGGVQGPGAVGVVLNMGGNTASWRHPVFHRRCIAVCAVQAAPGFQGWKLLPDACRQVGHLAVVDHGRWSVLTQDRCIHHGAVSDVDRHQYQSRAPEPVHEDQATPVIRREEGDSRSRRRAHRLRAGGHPVGERHRLCVRDFHRALQHKDRARSLLCSPVQSINGVHAGRLEGCINPSRWAAASQSKGTQS